MKRRLAWLLALSLTFASLPVTGVGAAENTAGGTESVTQEVQEEATEVESALKTALGETTSENTQGSEEQTVAEGQSVVSEQKESSENAGTKVVLQETTEAATEGTTEAAAAGATEEAAVGTTVNTETAAVVEPVEDTVVVDATADTADKKTGWIQENGKWYYFNAEGKAVIGWQDIDEKRYYFDATGAMVNGWQKIDGKWYYFATNGALQTGWQKINEKWFYFGSDGVMVTGHQDISGRHYYFAGNGQMLNGWQIIDGKWQYLGTDGAFRTGWQFVNSKWYYIDSENGMLTYWNQIGGNWYFLGGDGAMRKGWLLNGGYYYYLKSNGIMVTHWNKIGVKWYYFNDDGQMLTGIQQVGVKYYSFGTGAMQTGWVKQPSGLWSYYTENGPSPGAGWQQKGSDWFFLYTNGVARTGWMQRGSVWYYFSAAEGGRMLNAPTLIGNNIYFFYSNGQLASTKGWKTYNGNKYYTNEKGVCYRNTTIDGIKINENGIAGTAMDIKAQGYSSNTNYLILVDKTIYTVGIYHGSKGNWTKVKEWYCTHGGSNTPNGTWVIDDHVTKHDATYGWADFDYSSAAFAVHISAGNYFHSVLYEKYTRGNPYNQEIMDPDLKQNYSHGCIRLKTANAEWIWDNIPFGTKVVVYNS